MKVVFVASQFWASAGVGRSIIAIAQRLQARGHAVTVLANSLDRGPIVPTKRDPALPTLEEVEGLPAVRYWATDVPAADELAELTRRYPKELSGDVVHAFAAIPPVTQYAREIAAQLDVPLVTTFTGRDAYEIQRGGGREAVALAEASDVVIFCSRALHRMVEAALSESALGRSEVVYMGVADDLTGVGHRRLIDRPYVLTLARLEPTKGVDLGIRAFAGVTAAHPDLHYVICGRGSDDEIAGHRRLSAELGIADRVHLLGERNREEVASLLRYCECAVIPSRQEAFGLVTMEAMLFGRPVAAFNTGGLPEAVDDGVTGFLVQPEDEASLAASLQRLLESDRLRARMGAAARLAASRHSWEATVDAHLRCYATAGVPC